MASTICVRNGKSRHLKPRTVAEIDFVMLTLKFLLRNVFVFVLFSSIIEGKYLEKNRMIYNSDIMYLPISGKVYWNDSFTADAAMTAYVAIGCVSIKFGNIIIYRLFTELSPDCVVDKSLPKKFAYKDSDPYITHTPLVSIQRQLCHFLCRKLDNITGIALRLFENRENEEPPPKREVTHGPKPVGAQLPYESDACAPGKQFYVRSRRRV